MKESIISEGVCHLCFSSGVVREHLRRSRITRNNTSKTRKTHAENQKCYSPSEMILSFRNNTLLHK